MEPGSFIYLPHKLIRCETHVKPDLVPRRDPLDLAML